MSFQKILSCFLAVVLGYIIITTTLQDFNESSKEGIGSIGQSFVRTINPFWSVPNVGSGSFSLTFPVPLQNNTNIAIIPGGKLQIFEMDWTQIKNIALSENSWSLIDYIPINPQKTIISPNSSGTLDVIWRWFGDQFIKDWIVQTTFIGPFEQYEDFSQYSLSFWEKSVEKTVIHPYTLKTELTTTAASGGISTPQKVEDQNFSVKYSKIENVLNTGLIIQLGIISIILLLLWDSLRKKWSYSTEKKYIITDEEKKRFEEFEASIRNETKKHQEIAKVKKKIVVKKIIPKKKISLQKSSQSPSDSSQDIL